MGHPVQNCGHVRARLWPVPMWLQHSGDIPISRSPNLLFLSLTGADPGSWTYSFRDPGMGEIVMGSQHSKPEAQTWLRCLTSHLTTLDLSKDICKWKLILLGSRAWPQYPLDNQSHWPPEGTFDFSLLTDLSNYCHRTGKWSEVPYVQPFWALHCRPDLCVRCSSAQVLL